MADIRLKHIDFLFGKKPVFQNFSFEFKSGKSYGILGPTGCGKTTLLRLISGLETLKQGQIFIDNQLVSSDNNIVIPPHKRNCGFVFQDLALWPHFTVYKNIAFALKSQEKDYKQKVDDMLRYFNLEEHKYKFPHQLSGGQKQMTALARSLVLEPKILLLDEPLSNLDIPIKKEILKHLYDIQKQQKFTMLFVTHNLEVINQSTDEILVLEQGDIIFSGKAGELKESNHKFIKSFF